MGEVVIFSPYFKNPLFQAVTFHDIFERLAKEGKTNKGNLLLTLNDRRIYPEDTPEQIGLTVVDFIGE